METVIILLRGCSLGIFIVLSLKLYLDCRQYLAGRLLLALLVCTSIYLVEPYLPGWNLLEVFTRTLSGMVAPLYWLFTVSLIHDWDYQQRGLGRWRIVITCMYLLVVLLELSTQYSALAYPQAAKTGLFYLSYLFRLAFLAMAFITSVSTWRQDLVEARRWLRLLIVGSGVSITLLITLLELSYGGAGQPLALILIHASVLLLLSLVVSMWLLFITPDGITASIVGPHISHSAPSNSEQTPRQVATNNKWLDALVDYVENQQGYRKSGLSIGGLGEELGIPEHHLRKLINQKLGYRNFSDFLNHYRIAEAASRLAAQEEAHLPILTIALEVGYGSLSPFNRAFKGKMEKTPSEYRRLHSSPTAN